MKKVLIIDDEENLRDVYREVFEDKGFEVDTAVDGEDGVGKITAFLPDVILLDFMMPKMTGMDLLKYVKENPKFKDIKILVTTNIFLDSEDLKRNWGVSSVLIKVNYTPGQIVDEVRRVIDSNI